MLALTGPACGQFLTDGTFDRLVPGKAPDCDGPAGAWFWPAHYLTPENVCERDREQISIVRTATVDPSRQGNSMQLLARTSSTENISLPHLFPRVIHEVQGQVLRIEFDVYVPSDGMSGGSVYVGGDHSTNGLGGFANVRDRGPQISWNLNRTITARTQFATVVLVNEFPLGRWQRVALDIDLWSDVYDAWWASGAEPLQLVGQSLGFRSGTQRKLDRFTVAHFADITQAAHMFYDNIRVKYCYADCDQGSGMGVLDVFDFLCFGNLLMAGSPYACECDQSSGPGVCDIFDLLCFGMEFSAGCP